MALIEVTPSCCCGYLFVAATLFTEDSSCESKLRIHTRVAAATASWLAASDGCVSASGIFVFAVHQPHLRDGVDDLRVHVLQRPQHTSTERQYSVTVAASASELCLYRAGGRKPLWAMIYSHTQAAAAAAAAAAASYTSSYGRQPCVRAL
eukprot:COSAG01_NODE_8112_length_2916_cov_1.794817_5_plen_150_part_00